MTFKSSNFHVRKNCVYIPFQNLEKKNAIYIYISFFFYKKSRIKRGK